MDREQQYRTGRWPLADVDAERVREQVTAIMQGRDGWAGGAEALRRQHSLLRQALQAAQQVAAARTLLGLHDAEPAPGLLAHTRLLAQGDPGREAEYWEAMWVLRRPSSALEEYLTALPAFADALEYLAQQREGGWPDAWFGGYLRAWRSLGGTAVSARAWDAAGWGPADVLLEPVMAAGRYLPIAARVTCLRPPHFQGRRRQPHDDVTALTCHTATTGGIR